MAIGVRMFFYFTENPCIIIDKTGDENEITTLVNSCVRVEKWGPLHDSSITKSIYI